MTFPTISQRRVIQAVLTKTIPAHTPENLNQLVDMFEHSGVCALGNLHLMLNDGIYKQEHPDIVRAFLKDLCEYAEKLGRLDRLMFGKEESIIAARE